MVRAAVPADVPDLIELIHELARYENEPEAVHNNVALLHEALFGSNPRVHALVVEADGRVVGCAIWFVTYSTWTGRHGLYLDDLIITEPHRRFGHGRALMVELARICRDRGYGRFEWTVLDWNESALGLYRSLGAEPMSEWTVQRLSGPALTELAESR